MKEEHAKVDFDVTSTAKTVNAMEYSGKDPVVYKKQANDRGQREKPLFKDDIMPLFIDEQVKLKVTPLASQSVSTALRHRFFRRALSDSVKKASPPTRQVVILGSGFDTLAVRKNKYTKEFGVQFFEIDHQKILSHKLQKYQEKNIDPNASYIQMDYLKEDFMGELRKQKLDFKIPTHFMWEGNTMYFEKTDDIDKIIMQIKQNFDYFIITLDYVHLAFLENRTGNKEVEKVFEQFSKRGARWKTGIENIKSLADKHGLMLVDDQTLADLNKAYQVDNNPAPTQSYFSVSTLKNSL